MTPVATDPSGFQKGLSAYLGSVGGRYSVYLSDLSTGQEMGMNQDTTMTAASVIKVPLALYLLHQVEAGAVSLDDQVVLQQDDFMTGTGTLYGSAHAGDRYTMRDLLTVLIRQSDNTAWRALGRVLGRAAIDAYAAQVGAPGCTQDGDDCTAKRAGLLLARLSTGGLLNADHTQYLLQLLESTAFNDRINYYLSGVPIAHKVGMLGGVINDTGVVFAPGHQFVVSVFTDGSPTVGIQAIRDIARAAWSYYVR
jgi:beta-lactamase class A